MFPSTSSTNNYAGLLSLLGGNATSYANQSYDSGYSNNVPDDFTNYFSSGPAANSGGRNRIRIIDKRSKSKKSSSSSSTTTMLMMLMMLMMRRPKNTAPTPTPTPAPAPTPGPSPVSPPAILGAYLAHELVHALDRDGASSIQEEQEAYRESAMFWQHYRTGESEPNLDKALMLFQQSAQQLDTEVRRVYSIQDPSIPETSPGHGQPYPPAVSPFSNVQNAFKGSF